MGSWRKILFLSNFDSCLLMRKIPPSACLFDDTEGRGKLKTTFTHWNLSEAASTWSLCLMCSRRSLWRHSKAESWQAVSWHWAQQTGKWPWRCWPDQWYHHRHNRSCLSSLSDASQTEPNAAAQSCHSLGSPGAKKQCILEVLLLEYPAWRMCGNYPDVSLVATHGRLKIFPSFVRNHAFLDQLGKLAINNGFDHYAFKATKYGGNYIHAVFTLCKPSKKGLHMVHLLHYFTGILWLGNCRTAVNSKLPKSQDSGVCSMRCVFWGL